VESLGYKTILAEGADKILGWRSPNYVYQPKDCQQLKLLLRNYSLTDDVAFRFLSVLGQNIQFMRINMRIGCMLCMGRLMLLICLWILKRLVNINGKNQEFLNF